MSTFEIIMAIINFAAIITVPIAAVFVGQKLQDRSFTDLRIRRAGIIPT